MQTAKQVYQKVKQLQQQKGRDVKSCCRSVAMSLHIPEGEVEVVVASQSDEMYKKLGFDVRQKI